MAIKISNSRFRITNSLFKNNSGESAAEPPPAGVGVIFRVANTQGITSDSFTYTDINGNTAFTDTLSPGSITYVLALSGSLNDAPVEQGNFTVTNLLITSSIEETPSFTEELITTTGAGTWTKPSGVTQVIVECWGGGGAGGGASTNNQAGSGGAGGGYARKLIIYDSAQSNKSYSVAATVAGTAGNGATGNDTTWETTVAIGKGGGGGAANDLNGSGPGVPSTSNVGDITYNGGFGGQAFTARTGDEAGYGGYGAGVEKGGVDIAGPSATTGQSNGFAGNNYGGGGTGGYRTGAPNKTGGAGAQGLIRLIYR